MTEDVVDPASAHRHDPARLAAAVIRLAEQESRHRPASPDGPDGLTDRRMSTIDRDLVAAMRAELAAIEPARACDLAAERAGLEPSEPRVGAAGRATAIRCSPG